jgi:hypothetical protein
MFRSPVVLFFRLRQLGWAMRSVSFSHIVDGEGWNSAFDQLFTHLNGLHMRYGNVHVTSNESRTIAAIYASFLWQAPRHVSA